MTDKLRRRSHGLLWFGGEELTEWWSITDPTSEKLREAMHRLRYDDRHRTVVERQDIFTVLRAAEDYQHLTTYALGVEHIIRKLRIIWRAVKSRS